MNKESLVNPFCHKATSYDVFFLGHVQKSEALFKRTVHFQSLLNFHTFFLPRQKLPKNCIFNHSKKNQLKIKTFCEMLC